MRRCSPDPRSGRSPGSSEPLVHLIARGRTRDPRRHGFDATVAAFVLDCRSRGLSPRTVEYYLEGLTSFRATLLGPGHATLAELTLPAARAWLVLLSDGDRRPASGREWATEQLFRHRAEAIRATALRVMAASGAPEEAARPLLDLGRRLTSTNRAPVRRDLLLRSMLVALGQLRDASVGDAGPWWYAPAPTVVSAEAETWPEHISMTPEPGSDAFPAEGMRHCE